MDIESEFLSEGLIYEDPLDIEHLKSHLEEMVFQVYVGGDITKIEESLEEMAYALDVKIPKIKPKLKG